MGLIKCPECGKEVSDKAPTCPNCGVKIKKKKPVWLIIIAAICGLIAVFVLFSAIKDFTIATNSPKEDTAETETSETIIETEISETSTKGETSTAKEFKVATNEEIATLPDQDGLIESVGTGSELIKILSNMGVTNIDGNVVIGNYQKYEDIYNIDLKCDTSDDKTLLIGLMYIGIISNPEWTVTSVYDYNSGNLYYIPDELKSTYDIDIYDYKTGNLISKATKNPKDIMQ